MGFGACCCFGAFCDFKGLGSARGPRRLLHQCSSLCRTLLRKGQAYFILILLLSLLLLLLLLLPLPFLHVRLLIDILILQFYCCC